jgi:hypothetical protein
MDQSDSLLDQEMPGTCAGFAVMAELLSESGDSPIIAGVENPLVAYISGWP